MSLEQDIQSYLARGLCPMHMPGHKRNPAFDKQGLFSRDLTETDGTDDLHHPVGMLQTAQARAAALYGADACLFSVNGGTGAMLTAISAAVPTGSSVIVARNCHQSVYNALYLRGLKPCYIFPETDTVFGICGSVTPGAVKTAFARCPGAAAVILTSPTYEGVVSDIAALADITHAHGVPLLVDAAHGAHLGFSPRFPQNPIRLGADIAVESLHKTLPSPTQTAVLLTKGERVPLSAIRRFFAVYVTSSPSYPLLSAMDACIGLLAEQQTALFETLADRLEAFSERMCRLSSLRVLAHGSHAPTLPPAVFDFDRSKLLINTGRVSMTGYQLADILRTRFSIETEMAMPRSVLALSTVCDSAESFERLGAALLTLDRETKPGLSAPVASACPQPEVVLSQREAWERAERSVPLAEAVNRIARSYVCAYPPGTPVLVPGERVTAEAAAYLRGLLEAGGRITGMCASPPYRICVCAGEKES